MQGLVILDKPEGITSHTAVRAVRRILGVKKAGHTGTLDPLATGVLPVLVGGATRLSQYLTANRKEYRAAIALGTATDTLDRAGEVVKEAEVPPFDEERVMAILSAMEGPGEQVPPMYSARKVNGQPLYKAARAGRTVERKAKPIVLHRLALVSCGESLLVIDVACSAGTYIRVLAEEIAHGLGTVGHLRDLRRTASGRFRIEDAVSLDDLEGAAERDGVSDLLLPPARLLEGEMRRITIGRELTRRVCQGGFFGAGDVESTELQDPPGDGEPFCVTGPDGALIAIATARVQGGKTLVFRPARVFARAEELC